MFGRVNVWGIAELIVDQIKFGEWINFGHKDTIYKLKFEVGEAWTIHQTFPLPNIPAIRYCISSNKSLSPNKHPTLNTSQGLNK